MPSRPSDASRRCPVCSKVLVARTIRSVPVDSCDEHGLWLDKGELEGLMARQRESAARLRQYAARNAREEGRWEGVLFDWLAFLLPGSSPPPARRLRSGRGKRP